MNSYIDALQRWLKINYESLGMELALSANEYEESVVFTYVDEALSNIETPSNNVLILDPQVGVALFMLSFDDDVDIRAQLAKAINYRTRLLRKQIEISESDERGGWRVILHWFVDGKNRDFWIESAARMRSDTAHLEELPIDAIFCNDDDWDNAIEKHGIPRLMFRTRKVLGMSSDTDVFNWSSADSRVNSIFEGFSKGFKNDLEVQYAKKIEQWVLEYEDPKVGKKKSISKTAKEINHFGVRNFRNIESFDIRFDEGEVQAAVVHGPNGTGKSNLFEALEIAVCGSSHRAEKFFKDSDVTKFKKTKEYQVRYIKPILNADVETCLELNEEKRAFLFGEQDNDIESIDQLKSNFLTQEDSWRFAENNATQLAGEILGEFSDLAYEVTAYSESELEKARAGQNSLLSSLGLERRVKRTDTAYKKIINKYLLDALVQPASLMEWLSNPLHGFSRTTVNSGNFGLGLSSISDRVENVSNDFSSIVSREYIEELIRSILLEGWGETRATSEYLSDIKSMVDSWPDNIVEKIQLWSSWLISQKTEKDTHAISSDLAEIEDKRVTLEKKLEEIAKDGRVYSERESHFERVELFLDQIWLNVDSDHCPTCDTDLRERGGVYEVISLIRKDNEKLRNELREKYKINKKKLDVLLVKLSEFSKSKCPIPNDEQDEIRRMVSPHLPSGEDLVGMIADQTMQSKVIDWLMLVTRLPVLPRVIGKEQEDEAINDISKKIFQACENVETTFEAPAAWDRVVKNLKARLASVLDEHMPNTLGGVWKELVINMTPARWQMPGELGFTLESRRGRNQATIALESEGSLWLARYVLNAAESHILGIAWFFTKYLTHGRFNYSLLAMDDPAQEMDQVTYRDLCRLLESLMRLHLVNKLPLSMLLFLHQDERALDASRATGSLLYHLNWNKGRSVLSERTYLYSPEHRHPKPAIFLSNRTDEKVEGV